jgi:transcriptional regulator with XRE-family HTH domain
MKDTRIRLGKRIRHLRQSRGWSQETLGEKAGLHPTYIGGIERGERNVSLVNLTKLSDAFQLRLAELVELNGETPGKDEVLKKLIAKELHGDDELASAFFETFCRQCDNIRMLQEFCELLTRATGRIRSRISPEQH